MKLNLGCGRFPVQGFVNVDSRPLSGVDVVADLDRPWPWSKGSVDYVRASHVIEHIQDVPHFVSEAHRVLSGGGVLDVTAPHWQHMNAYTDPTHRRALTPHSFEFWTGNQDYEQYGPRFEERAILESPDEVRFLLLRGWET